MFYYSIAQAQILSSADQKMEMAHFLLTNQLSGKDSVDTQYEIVSPCSSYATDLFSGMWEIKDL